MEQNKANDEYNGNLRFIINHVIAYHLFRNRVNIIKCPSCRRRLLTVVFQPKAKYNKV